MQVIIGVIHCNEFSHHQQRLVTLTRPASTKKSVATRGNRHGLGKMLGS